MSSSPSNDSSDPESHKNEGFLKSMWHNLTNHPAHQNNGENTTGPNKEEKKPNSKSEEEQKKSSESGSG